MTPAREPNFILTARYLSASKKSHEEELDS